MAKVTLTDLLNEDQRYLILLSLMQMGYDGNANMLITALDAHGHRVSVSKMMEHLNYLSMHQLLTLEEIGNFTKAVLTQKGQDVAEGRERAVGVRQPRAGEI